MSYKYDVTANQVHNGLIELSFEGERRSYLDYRDADTDDSVTAYK